MALPDPDIVQPSGPVFGGPEGPVFSPHTGDHGGTLFNHPSTNRGGSPGVLNGEPVMHGGTRGRAPSPFTSHPTGQRRIDIPVPPKIGPRRIDTGAPKPVFSTPDNPSNGAPRRANQGISNTPSPPPSTGRAPNLPNRLAR